MSDELTYDDDSSIDYYEVLGVQQWSSRIEIYMAYRKLTAMPPNSELDSHDAVDIEKIELLKRAKKVLTSTRLKKAYDTKRADKMKTSISARSGEKNDVTTSFDEWIDSCSERLSDSDLSSHYSSSESGGKCSEKYQQGES